MRIAFLCAGWRPDVGGVETHAADLAHRLVRSGHSIEVLCLDRDAGRAPFAVRDEVVDDVRVRRMAPAWSEVAKLVDLVSRPRADRVVGEWLDQRIPDVVHVHHATGFGTGALRVIEERGLPSIVTLHDYWALCPRGQMLHVDGSECAEIDDARCGACLAATWPALVPDPARAATPAMERTRRARTDLARADMLLTPSRASADILRACGLARTRVVENGVDVEGLRDATRFERLARVADGELHLGVLGTVQPSKGQLELARAFLASARGNGALVLDVHGAMPDYHGDDAYVRALRALAATDARIRLHGVFPGRELGRVLAGLDALAAPSRWREVSGLTAREARAAGLFVLASDVGGLGELGARSRHVRLVPARDERAWIAALDETFARGAPARVDPEPGELVDLDSMARAIEEIYGEARAARRVPARVESVRR